tara:strand:+ start:454 stop:951 length:498 start_codon:yes stop_codon:yes gene_type:complete
MLENQVKRIYLGIGSNLGNKLRNIENAKFYLIQNNIKIIQSSSYYESLSWPNPNNPKFFNIVLEISTNLAPLELLKKCKKIETMLGRTKSIKNAPRVCDIDILDFANKFINKGIFLPHPLMHKRNFVLLPLFELNKNWIHPNSKQHIKKLLLLLSNRDIRSIKQL